MSVNGPLLLVGLLVTLGSIASALDSPCPDLFHYDSTDQPGQWTGTVTLVSDVELHGVWARLIFDGKLIDLDVDDNLEVVPSDNHKEFLIKNKDILLKSATPRHIKITVKYDGNEVPSLIGYRLNANMVCAAGTTASEDFFPGDLGGKSFLTSLTSKKLSADFEFEGCGTVPLLQDNELKNEKAQKGQWPWQAAVFIQKNNGEQYICEGTLISSRYVITSAHCVTYQKSELVVPVRRLIVYLGKHSLGSGNNEQKLKASRVVLHPGYRGGSVLDDLALIELEKPIIVNDYARPICLKRSSDKKEGFLVGYGINQDQKMGDLMQAQVRMISEDNCSKRIPDYKGLLTDGVFCASYVQDNSLCVGDSGSSLALLREGTRAVWELKGVVTVGVALQDKYLCNHSSTVFLTDIANYLKWIQEVIS